MRPDQFKHSLSEQAPPDGLSPALTALWWVGKNAWEKAHALVMNEPSAECAWVHAHLHRVEGDLDNAGYWYRRAHRAPEKGDFASEWLAIVSALIESERR